MCSIDDLNEQKFKIFVVKDLSIGLVKLNEQVKAILNYCPHAGAELCKGSVRQTTEADEKFQIDYDVNKIVISCPWHGWEFNLSDGKPVFDGRCKPVRTFNVRIKDSFVHIAI